MVKQRRKKNRTHVEADESGVPKSFVMHRGEIGHALEQLIRDVRSVMEPYTASKLKVRRQNVLKDFVHIAGPMGITHFLIFNQTEMGVNLRVARLPRGPTLSFRVSQIVAIIANRKLDKGKSTLFDITIRQKEENLYAIKSDVVALQRRPHSPASEYKFPALLVLNNFPKEEFHMKLIVTMFQNMFPSIDVQNVQLAQVRRCVLINYDKETGNFEFRHYFVNVMPAGLSRTVKKIIQSRIPDLSKVDDIADYVMSQGGMMSDSEAEEAEDSKVVLPQKMLGVGNAKSGHSAIKLQELGPRMTLNLIKVEEGFCDGDVLHHEFVSKTPEEVEAMKNKRLQKQKEKADRKRQQEENVKRKEKAKALHKQMCASGQAVDSSEDSDGYKSQEEKAEASEDDMDYYRREVGEEPDPDLFYSRKGKGKSAGGLKGKGRGGDEFPEKFKGGKRGRSDDSASASKKRKFEGGSKKGDGKPGSKPVQSKPKVGGFLRKRQGK